MNACLRVSAWLLCFVRLVGSRSVLVRTVVARHCRAAACSAAVALDMRISHHPPLSALPALVDVAMKDVRLYMYPLPPQLEDVIDLKLQHVHGHASCGKQRAKHPWINLEDRLWEILPPAVWTNDSAAATFYVVPHKYIGHQCAVTADHGKHYVQDALGKFFEYIYHALPYYNHSGGRDHITTWIFENGPMCDCDLRQHMYSRPLAFHMLMSFIKVGHWAHEDVPMFGWRWGQDIAMPQYGAVSPSLGPPPTWQEVVTGQKFSFGFSGSYWGRRVTCPATVKGAQPDTLGGTHGCECSPGIRTWLHDYLLHSCNSSNTRPSRCAGSNAKMGTFLYALCPAAWACWSSRMYHAIDRLVIPAIMADGAIQPFEQILNWSHFSVNINTTELKSGDVSQLDELHDEAASTIQFCTDCPTCHNCTRLPLVKRVRHLETVRTWFLYNGSEPYNAVGLFLLELYCRQWHLRNDERDGVCRHYRLRHGNGSLAPAWEEAGAK